MRRDAGMAPVVLGRDLHLEQLTEADAPEGGLLPEAEMIHRVCPIGSCCPATTPYCRLAIWAI
jgi:hypothetical protein